MRAAAGWIVVALGLLGAEAWAGELVAYRALYRMALGSATPGSGIVGAEGAMVYRFAAACDGWTVENQTYLLIRYAEGDDVESTWAFASWESKDGLSYRFRVHHARDGRTVERLRGKAALERVAGTGVARFAEPADTAIDLPAGTLFPTEHLRTLIRQALGGAKHEVKIVFDGASLDNPYEISAVIGAVSVKEQESLAAAAGLDARPAWNMRWAFFPLRGTAAVPEFEIEVRYREDGIADRLTQDFGNFSIDLKLGEIKLLDAPVC